jgi:hypothetical protein
VIILAGAADDAASRGRAGGSGIARPGRVLVFFLGPPEVGRWFAVIVCRRR